MSSIILISNIWDLVKDNIDFEHREELANSIVTLLLDDDYDLDSILEYFGSDVAFTKVVETYQDDDIDDDYGYDDDDDDEEW